MTVNGAQHYVLCEGYDDRSFLASVFELLGLASMRSADGGGPLVDAWCEALKGGIFGFRSSSDAAPVLRLQEVQGVTNMARVARIALAAHETKPLASLTLVRDDDTEVGETPLDVVAWVRGIFSGDEVTAKGPCAFSVRGIRVNVVVWRVDGTSTVEGIPSKQTLERLVCTALAEVEPLRAQSVHRWLMDPPSASNTNEPKAVVGSYVAKWYAEDRLDEFYRRVVRSAPLRDALRSHLELSGAWGIFAYLAGTEAT